MMKRTINSRTRFLRVLTLCIALCFSFGQINAQITISTTVPTGSTDALNIGVGTASFSVTIANTGSGNTNIASLVLNQPTGVSLVSARASIGTVQYVATVQDDKTIGLNIDLPAYQTLTVQYLKKANCAAVPNGTSNYSVLVNDNITINSSLGTNITSTNSYPLLFPGLKVSIPGFPFNEKAVQWRLPFTDSIPVVNPPQAGKAKNMLFSMKWAIAGALGVHSMAVQKAGGTSVNIPNIVTQGDSAIISIDSTILAQMGFTDGILNPTDSFKVFFSATPLIYFAKLQTTYSIRYLADGSTCQTLSNAMDRINYNQLLPNPVVTMRESIQSFADFCGTDFKATYTLTNTAAANTSNDMMNVFVTSESFQNAQLISVMVNNIPIVPVNGKYYIGTSDLNGDGLINDLAAHDSVIFSVEIRPTNYPGGSFTNNIAHTKIKYNRIDGEVLDYSDVNWSVLDYPTLNVSGPSDIVSGQSGNYTIVYSGTYNEVDDARALYKSSFWAICDVTKEEIPLDSSSFGTILLDGHHSFSFPVSCSTPLTFRLVMKTAGCDASTTITTASASTVVSGCPGSGGSGCYNTFTDKVDLSKTQMNSCETVDISSSGHIDHWCKPCLQITTLIAKVYSLNSESPFSAATAQLFDAKGVFVANGTAVTADKGMEWHFTYSPTLSCVDSIVNTNSFSIKVTGMQIGSDHSLPDRSDMNIRVAYAFIDASGTTNEYCIDKGAALSVYDPEPSFLALYNTLGCCGDAQIYAKVSSKATSGTSAGIVVKEVDYPAFSNYYVKGQGYANANKSNTVFPSAANGKVSPGGGQYFNETLYAVQTTDSSQITVNQCTIVYDDFIGTNCADTYKGIIRTIPARDIMIGAPTLKLYPGKVEQSKTATTTWSMKIENDGINDAQNVMLQLNVAKTNKIQIIIDSVKLGDIKLPLVSNGNIYYVTVNNTTSPLKPLQARGSNTMSQEEIIISARSLNCVNDTAINHIGIRTAWSCETIDKNNFAIFDCNVNTDLQLQNLSGVLNPIEQYPADSLSFGLCQNIPIKVAINNIGSADIDSLGFWITKIPVNMTLTGNKFDWIFNGKHDSIIQSLPTINLLASNYLISQKILSNIANPNQAAAPLHYTDPIIQLGFNVKMHCNGKPEITIDTLKFHTQGINNCGDVQQKDFIYLPQLKGFEHLNDLKVTATGGTFISNKGTSTILAKVTNTSKVFVDSAYITVKLPTGVEFLTYTPASGTFVHSVDTSTASDGIQTVQFELTKHQNIAAGDSVSVTITVTDKLTCPPLASTVEIMGTLKRKMVDCENESCMVEASTQADSLHLKRIQAPFTPTITDSQTVCSNSTVTLTAGGAQSYVWNDGDVTATTSVTPTTTTTYSVIATSAAGCIGTNATKITIIYAPATPVITPLPTNINRTTPPFALTTVLPESGTVFYVNGVESTMLDPSTLLCDSNNIIYCSETNSCGTSYDTTSFIYNCCAIKILGPDTVCAKDTGLKHGYTVAGTASTDSITWWLDNNWENVLTPKADSVYVQLGSGWVQTYTLYASLNKKCKDSLQIYSAPIPIFAFNGPKVDTICVLSGFGLNFNVFQSTWPVTIQYFDGKGDTIPQLSKGFISVGGSLDTKEYRVHAFDGHCFDTTYTTTVYRHIAPDAWFETTQGCEGDTIEMEVYARDLNNCGYNWYTYNVQYDTSAMHYVGFSLANTITPNQTAASIMDNSGSIQAYVSPYDLFYITSSKSLMTTLKFVVKKAGSANISFDSLTFCGLPKTNLYDSVITIGKHLVVTDPIEGRDTLCWNTQDEIYSVAPSNDIPSRWKLNPESAGIVLSQGRSASYSTAVGFGGIVDLQAIYDATSCSPSVTLHKYITILRQPTITDYQRDTLWECASAGGNQFIGYSVNPDNLINYTVWDANHTIVSNSSLFNFGAATIPNQVDKFTFEISHRLCPLPTIHDSIFLARYPLPIASASANPVCQSDTLRVQVSLSDIRHCEFSNISFSAFFDETKYHFEAVSLDSSMLNNNWYNHITTTTTHFVGGENIRINFHNLSLYVPINTQTFVTLLFVPLQAGTSTMHINDIVYNIEETLTNAVAQIDVPVTVYTNPTISIANGSVCSGSTFTFAPNVTSGTPAYTYFWSNGSTNPTISVLSTGNYTLSVSDSHGCKANASANLTVLPVPIITALANQSTICTGDSTTITAGGGTNYIWSNGLTTTSITVTPSVNTIYTVTGTNASGCSNSATTTIIVNAKPTVTVLPTIATVCSGSIITLTADGATSYAWSSGDISSAITVLPTSNTSYTVTGYLNGCSASATKTVTVNTTPTVTVLPTIATICSGSNVTLTANGATSYIWSNAATTAGIIVTPTANTIYTVTGTTNGCSAITTRAITVNPTPTITIVPPLASVCVGSSLILTASGATSYSWNTGVGTSTILVTPTVSNSYTVTGTANGCSATATRIVTVNPKPTISIAPNAVNLCLGGSTSITANGAASYIWSTAATTAGITVTPTISTTYFVTGTDAYSCKNTTSVTVTVNPLPTITVTSGSLNGSSYTLTATTTGNIPFSYVWSNTNTNNNIDVVNLPGTYIVTVNDGNGCKATATGTVTIFPAITNVCSYQPGINLNAGTYPPNTTYLWSNGLAWNPIWVATNGNYTVTVTTPSGQKYISTTTVVIHPTYNPTITTNSNGTVTNVTNGMTITNCPGIPLTLNANGGEVQYIWNNVTGINPTFTTNSGGNITLGEVDQFGCPSTTVNLTLQYYQVPQAIISQSAILTGSNTATLTLNDGNFTSFIWSNGSTARSITINSAGIYSVTGTTANGCQSVTTITEVLNTVPLSIIKQSATTGINLIAQSLYSDYRWYNVSSPNQQISSGSTINVTNAGTYRVDEYNNGTLVASTTVTVILDTTTGKLKNDVISMDDVENTTSSIEQVIISPTVAEINTVTVIPQPAKNEVRVVSSSLVKSIVMYDLNGKIVISVKNKTIIDISMLQPATYQIVIETEAGIFNRTVVVVK
jgi:hypothetical protein